MVTNISLLRSPGNVIALYTADPCLIHPRHNSLGREKYLLPRFNPDSLDSLVFSPRLFQGKSRVCQQLSRETRSLPGGRGRTGRPGPPSGSDITPHAPLSLTPELRPPLVMLHFKSLSLYFLDLLYLVFRLHWLIFDLVFYCTKYAYYITFRELDIQIFNQPI